MFDLLFPEAKICLFLTRNLTYKTQMIRKTIITFLLFSISLLYSQDYYSELRKKYWQYGENDQRAFTYLNLYIKSA